ncbi:hypothetical protein XA68_18231 [Ophiocordyceps unilateralis]|uniref:Uncharacterized protein n=1 Tax=Ophiocordyceps unilateralis TaxID=268505 RepID=A0A2A9PPC9_OPHUN|nr:hypothetical protein XA68_18231 [Ophiocordyceps unilateralis]
MSSHLARLNNITSPTRAQDVSKKYPELPPNSEVIELLKTLPQSRPFGVFNEGEKPELFRQLCLPLRCLSGTTTTTSRANCSKKHGNIIRRGESHVSFCHSVERGNDGEEHLCGDATDYGLLLFPAILGSIWDRNGLYGAGLQSSIQHLRRLNVKEVSERLEAKKVAKVLLDYHANKVCIANMAPGSHSGGKRGRESQRSGASVTKRQRVNIPTGRTQGLQPAIADNSPQPNIGTTSHSEDEVSTPIPQPVV